MSNLDSFEIYETKVVSGRKKLAILFIKDIITDNTNYRKTFNSNDIIKRLDEYPYSLQMECKAIRRIVNTLADEYPYIRKNDDGTVWYDRELDKKAA